MELKDSESKESTRPGFLWIQLVSSFKLLRQRSDLTAMPCPAKARQIPMAVPLRGSQALKLTMHFHPLWQPGVICTGHKPTRLLSRVSAPTCCRPGDWPIVRELIHQNARCIHLLPNAKECCTFAVCDPAIEVGILWMHVLLLQYAYFIIYVVIMHIYMYIYINYIMYIYIYTYFSMINMITYYMYDKYPAFVGCWSGSEIAQLLTLPVLSTSRISLHL